MFNRVIKIVALFALIISFNVFAYSQQKQEPAPAKSPDYVDFSGFKGKIFEIKYADHLNLASIISPLGSGFKGATIRPSRDPKLITVRDFP